MCKLIKAVYQLNKVSIYHRDLKLSNVLICNGDIKLSDFGLATNKKINNDYTGTMKYMSP